MEYEPWFVNKTALKAEIDRAEAFKASTSTADSWARVSSALGTAKNVYADDNATNAAVDSAEKALSDAINKLVPIKEDSKPSAKVTRITAKSAGVKLIKVTWKKITGASANLKIYQSLLKGK